MSARSGRRVLGAALAVLVGVGFFSAVDAADKLTLRLSKGTKAIAAVERDDQKWVSLDELSDALGWALKSSSLSGRVVMSFGQQQLTGFDGSAKWLANDQQAVETDEPVRFEEEMPYVCLSGIPVLVEYMTKVSTRWKTPMEELEVGGLAKPAGVKAALPKEIKRSLKTIILDPGHGGHDSGGRGKGLTDKEIALAVAKRLGPLLEEKGFKVLYTRTDDYFVTLPDRVALANQEGVDLFVSIHANATNTSKMSGSEVYIFNFYASSKEAEEVAKRENEGIVEDPLNTILRDLSKRSDDQASILAAGYVADALREDIAFHHRHKDILRAPFYVLSHTQMPALLIELGYLTNPKEVKMMKQNGVRDQFAKSILRGILAYRDAIETSPEIVSGGTGATNASRGHPDANPSRPGASPTEGRVPGMRQNALTESKPLLR